MSGELDLIRAFRAEDAVVDAGSQENARATLLEHIAASSNSTPRKRWGRLRRPSRPMAILLVALVIAGSAAAAVLSLSSSQPLAGRVPGGITPASVAGYNYTIAVTPADANLQAGGSGWESWIVYSRRGTTGYGGAGGGFCAPYPTATHPIFGEGSGPIFGGGTGPTRLGRGNTVAYVLTGPQVWAVRIGSRTIRTVTSRALPTVDRAAVFFVPAKGPVPVLIPGVPAGWPPGKHPRGMKDIPIVPIVPLNRSGQVVATTQCAPPPPGPWPLTWMAPNAVTRWWPLPGLPTPYHGPGYHAPTRPVPGVCALAQHGLPALHAQFGHTITWISPTPDALGEVFVSCVDTEYYLHGWPVQAGVLLDGHRPGRVLGPIPGARPVPGQPGMVDLATGHFPSSLFSRNFGVTAKRVGNAWLVVQGGSGLAQRVQVLNALRISKLDLHHLAPWGASNYEPPAVPGVRQRSRRGFASGRATKRSGSLQRQFPGSADLRSTATKHGIRGCCK